MIEPSAKLLFHQSSRLQQLNVKTKPDMPASFPDQRMSVFLILTAQGVKAHHFCFHHQRHRGRDKLILLSFWMVHRCRSFQGRIKMQHVCILLPACLLRTLQLLFFLVRCPCRYPWQLLVLPTTPLHVGSKYSLLTPNVATRYFLMPDKVLNSVSRLLENLGFISQSFCYRATRTLSIHRL